MQSRQSWRRRRGWRRSWHGSRYPVVRFRNLHVQMTKYVTKQVTVSLAGVTVREQEALQCLLDLPIDRCLEYLSPLRVIIYKPRMLIDSKCHLSLSPASPTALRIRPTTESLPYSAAKEMARPAMPSSPTKERW